METIKKYWGVVVIIIFAFLTVERCANDRQHELQGEYKQLKEQLGKLKTDLNAQEGYRQFLKDSFSREIKKSEEKVLKLQQNNLELKNKIVSLQKKSKEERDKIKNYSNEQFAKAFNERYKTNSTTSDATSVSLKDSIPRKVMEDLIDKDEFEDIVKVQDTIIDNMEKIVDEKDSIIEKKDGLLAESEKTIKLSKEALEKAEDLNRNAEKQISTLKIKNTVKTILIPAAIIGTILIMSR